MAANDLAAECFQAADGELLGLGVRIGTYLQVFSAIINLKLDADDAPGGAWLQCFTAVAILAFALKFVLQGTISNGMFLATAYIGWMQLLIQPAVLLLPAVRCLKLLVLLISVSILFAFSVLLWYFIEGYQRLENVAACGATQAFFFARVNAFGWFRWLNVGILGAAAAMLFALLTMVGPSTSFSRALRASCRRALKWPLSVMSVLLTLWAILIIGCELTISWNDVPDVYSLNSTGQIIPLLLGAGVISRDIYFSWARTRACMVDMQQRQELEEQQRWRQRLYGRGNDEGAQLHGAKTSVV